MPGLERENLCVEMARLPIAPRCQIAGKKSQSQPGLRRGSGDGAQLALAPQALLLRVLLPVVKENVGVVEKPADPELPGLPTDPPVEHHRGLAQRTIGYGDGRLPHHVIRVFVPNQYAQGIGPRLPVEIHADHEILVG